MGRRIISLSGILMMILLMGACGRGGGTDFGGEAAQPPAVAPVDQGPASAEKTCAFSNVGEKDWPVRICDSFDSNTRGWIEEKDSSDIASYDIRLEGGEYKVGYVGTAHAGYTSGGFLWIPIASGSDFALSVNGEMDSVNKLIGWGIVFRGSEGELYLYRISKDGRYDLEIQEGGTRRQIIDWKAHNAVKQEGVNRLGLVVEGDSVDLYANGQYLESFNEVTLDGELIALAVFGQEGVQVNFAFDDLAIQAP